MAAFTSASTTALPPDRPDASRTVGITAAPSSSNCATTDQRDAPRTVAFTAGPSINNCAAADQPDAPRTVAITAAFNQHLHHRAVVPLTAQPALSLEY